MEMEVAGHHLFIYFLKGEWKQASSEDVTERKDVAGILAGSNL